MHAQYGEAVGDWMLCARSAVRSRAMRPQLQTAHTPTAAAACKERVEKGESHDMCSRDLARTSRVTTHRPRFGRGRPPNIAGRGLDPKRLRPCAGLLSGVTAAGASVGWLSSDVASDSDAGGAASSCLEAVSVEAADASSLSLLSGVVAGAASSFSSGFSSSSTFFAPGR